MFTINDTTKAPPTPQLFYRFEITGADGQTFPVVISEDGLFHGDAADTATFDHQLDAVLQH